MSNYYAIYKPSSKGIGGAIQFKLDPSKGCIFIEAAPQTGQRSFDWECKVIMKLDLTDIGKIMAVLSKRTQECKLFHKSDKGQTTLDLRPGTSYGYMLYTTSSISNSKVSMPISDDEAEVLLALLRGVCPILCGWVR